MVGGGENLPAGCQIWSISDTPECLLTVSEGPLTLRIGPPEWGLRPPVYHQWPTDPASGAWKALRKPTASPPEPHRNAHDGAMKTQDPHQELQDGFELAPPPPIGPDGTPQIPRRRAGPPARPSLCQAGPCRRYHRLVVQVDAEQPGAVRLPIAPAYNHTREDSALTPCPECARGVLYRAPAAFHVQTHHYCYPDTGIEMPLGALPVVECNRWDPDIDVDGFWPDDPQIRPEQRRREFWGRPAGVAHRDAIACWEESRAAEQAEAAEADRLIAQSMAETPTIACQVCGNRFEEHELDVQMRCRSCVGANLQPRATPAPFHGVLRTCHPGNKCSNHPDCESCGPPRI